MPETPTWFLIVQAITSFAIVATFVVYWRMLIAMRKQLIAMQGASESQNVLTLINYLQNSSIRDDRKNLISLLGKPLASWTEEEKQSAERVCGNYDIAGILIRNGMVPEKIITENWGDSIIRCYNAASELIKEHRDNRGVEYWDDFEWLAEKVPDSHSGTKYRH